MERNYTYPLNPNPYPYGPNPNPPYYSQGYQFQPPPPPPPPPPPQFQPFPQPSPFANPPSFNQCAEQPSQFNGYNCPPPGFNNNINHSGVPPAKEFPNSAGAANPEKGSFPFNEKKRARPASPEQNDVGGYTKLYVAPVPRTITTEDMWPLFQQYGNVIEVVFPMDKKQRLRGEYCFVKYSTREEADKAIKALNGVYTIPGEALPIVVRYADMRRENVSKVEVERAGGAGEKLYVGGINKQASKQEIRELFSVYGNVEDIFIGRDEMKQSRGFAFVKFSHLDMAMTAIKDLHGIFTMRGCDQPLVVRFADPMKPRMLAGYGDASDVSDHGDASESSKKSSFSAGDTPKQGENSSEGIPIVPPESADPGECDWSEHTCPDGFKYYYNCITCESKWEMPEELHLFLQNRRSVPENCAGILQSL